jgi:enoyl-CoA hydratase
MGVLEITRAEGYVTITLNDPDRRNLLSPEMVDGLYAAVEGAEADEEVHALILTGNGRAFCSGADVSKLGDQDKEGLLHIYGAFLRVAASKLLTIAAINGAAVGAGVNLALAADIRIAAESSRYDTRFLSIGLHPGGGHTWMLQRAIGTQAASAMVLASQVISGPESERLGLSYKCVPDVELLSAAQALAEGAARTPRGLLIKTKETMRAVVDLESHDEAVAVELEAQLWSKTQPEFAERIAELQAKISSKKP